MLFIDVNQRLRFDAFSLINREPILEKCRVGKENLPNHLPSRVMHTHGKQAFFILLACGLTVGLQAQDAGTLPDLTPRPDAYHIERITAMDGLPISGITAIEQDEDGFLWFGGSRGLYRYDGYTFSPNLHDPADSTSLAANWAEALHVDPQGTMWVGTYGGGLNRFNPDTETFTAFRHDPGDPTSLSRDTVSVLLTDSRGTLWVGTYNGLNRFDPETETFTRFQHDPDDPNSLSNNQVRVVYEDRQGTLWVGTGSPQPTETPRGEGGLNRFHPQPGTFTRVVHRHLHLLQIEAFAADLHFALGQLVIQIAVAQIAGMIGRRHPCGVRVPMKKVEGGRSLALEIVADHIRPNEIVRAQHVEGGRHVASFEIAAHAHFLFEFGDVALVDKHHEVAGVGEIHLRGKQGCRPDAFVADGRGMGERHGQERAADAVAGPN